ncbi:MAG: winged helix-turn-helix transcriptional regulator [Thermomicrobiales bacterium]
MSQIDAIDERILTELQANGRLTMKALAERVGLSSPAMIERVRRLEERGIIAGYRAVVKPATLGHRRRDHPGRCSIRGRRGPFSKRSKAKAASSSATD